MAVVERLVPAIVHSIKALPKLRPLQLRALGSSDHYCSWGQRTFPLATTSSFRTLQTKTAKPFRPIDRPPQEPTTLSHEKSSVVLRVQGLPYRATEQDVLKFFRGYRPIENSVRIPRNKSSYSMEVAFVAFENEDLAEKARTELNRKSLFGRRLYLYPTRAGVTFTRGGHTGFLRMKGLPYSVTPNDILEFFNGHDPIPESIVIHRREKDGRPTGAAILQFQSSDAASRAMEEKHCGLMKDRFIELFVGDAAQHAHAIKRDGVDVRRQRS